jgi:hypothetical protein
MSAHIRTLVAVTFLILSVSAAVQVPAALASGKIAEVNVSADAQRVSIRTEGNVGRHAESAVSNPSRLVIDIPSATLARPLNVTGAGRECGLGIRAAKSDSGARIVLDFGDGPMPQYRIRKVGHYLLVFIQDWNPSGRPGSVTRPEPTATREVTPKRRLWAAREDDWRTTANSARRDDRQRAVPSVNHEVTLMEPRQGPREADRPEETAGEVFIKSAEVDDGTIVLQVARKDDPEKLYRIDLGVDFRDLGFKTAKISPVEEPEPQPAQVVARQSPFRNAASLPARIGPRKP